MYIHFERNHYVVLFSEIINFDIRKRNRRFIIFFVLPIDFQRLNPSQSDLNLIITCLPTHYFNIVNSFLIFVVPFAMISLTLSCRYVTFPVLLSKTTQKQINRILCSVTSDSLRFSINFSILPKFSSSNPLWNFVMSPRASYCDSLVITFCRFCRYILLFLFLIIIILYKVVYFNWWIVYFKSCSQKYIHTRIFAQN